MDSLEEVQATRATAMMSNPNIPASFFGKCRIEVSLGDSFQNWALNNSNNLKTTLAINPSKTTQFLQHGTIIVTITYLIP
jgi:hypothetical protein